MTVAPYRRAARNPSPRCAGGGDAGDISNTRLNVATASTYCHDSRLNPQHPARLVDAGVRLGFNDENKPILALVMA